jgi:hypothetical protein
MMAVEIVLMWLSCHQFTSGFSFWNFVAIAAALFWMRLVAAIVVRTSIKKSMQICLDAIRYQEGNVIIIGFSWGGAVRRMVYLK